MLLQNIRRGLIGIGGCYFGATVGCATGFYHNIYNNLDKNALIIKIKDKEIRNKEELKMMIPFILLWGVKAPYVLKKQYILYGTYRVDIHTQQRPFLKKYFKIDDEKHKQIVFW